MKITSDWHIHSQNSCDSACMTVATLVRRRAEEGIRAFGVTDHIHTPFNLPDLVASRKEYVASDPPPDFHFGVEASCVSAWELAELAKGGHANPVYGLREGGPAWAEPALGLTEANVRDLGIEYVVAGAHWPLYVPWEREAVIRDYHRQNLFLAAHPLVDIVAHPWWWMGHWQEADGRYPAEPWFDDFRKIPPSMHDEFADAAKSHGTAVEINAAAMLLNPGYSDRFKEQYLDYLAGLKARGVALSFGSDCHDADYAIDLEKAALMLDSVGIRDEDLWRLPPRSALAVAP
jgi:histidinol phosphatase-like PHP family hydrolase